MRKTSYNISSGRLESFGIATLLVILVHAKPYNWESYPNFLYKISELGSIGVDVFLFLSGIGLFYSLKKCNSIKTFYAHRIKRVFIPYVLLASLLYGIKLIMHTLSFSDWILHVSTLYLWIRGASVTWYISFILLLYLIYPLLYNILSKDDTPPRKTMLLYIVIFMLEVLIFILFPAFYSDWEFALSRIPIFMIGTIYGKYEYEQNGYSAKSMFLYGTAFVIMRSLLIYWGDSGNRIYQVGIRLSYILGTLAICECVPILQKLLPRNPIRWALEKIGGVSLEIYIIHSLWSQIFLTLKIFAAYHTPVCYVVFVVIPSILAVMLCKYGILKRKEHIQNELDEKRIAWIDFAKGIAMVLVILGHTVTSYGKFSDQLIRGMIFSFHMPLFFILSCATFNFSKSKEEFVIKSQKAFRHLIIPAIVLYAMRTLINIINNYEKIEWHKYLAEKINTLVYASGVDVQISDTMIPAFGMMWFFIVLFLGRYLYDYLHLSLGKKKFLISLFIFSILGIGLSYIQWLPLSFDIALAIMPFFLFGSCLKLINIEKHSILLGGASFLAWIGTFLIQFFIFHDYMELAGRRYPLFPLCYITAIAGTMFFAYFSKALVSTGSLKMIEYIGRYSIYLYGVHAMDYIYGFLWNWTENHMISAMIRIPADIGICLILIKSLKVIKPMINEKLRRYPS